MGITKQKLRDMIKESIGEAINEQPKPPRPTKPPPPRRPTAPPPKRPTHPPPPTPRTPTAASKSRLSNMAPGAWLPDGANWTMKKIADLNKRVEELERYITEMDESKK